jgi:hypothetical protein
MKWAGVGILLLLAPTVFASNVRLSPEVGNSKQSQAPQQSYYKRVATLTGLGDFGESMDRQGNYLFMARNNVMRIVDISTPLAPSVVGSWAHQGAAGQDVKVKGNYAFYVFNDSNTFNVIDHSTKSAPILVAQLTLPSGASAIAISGNYAFLTFGVLKGTNTFRTVDITTPASPVIVQQSTQIVLFNYPTSIVCVSTFCVVGHENNSINSIKVLGIADPLNVTDISGDQSAPMTSEPRGYNLYGTRYAIAGSWFETTGIMVVDLLDMTEPVLVGNRTLPNPTWSTYVWSHYAALGMTDNYIPGDNFRIFDIIQPTAPRLLSTESAKIFTAVNDMEVVGKYIFLSGRRNEDGLMVFELNFN